MKTTFILYKIAFLVIVINFFVSGNTYPVQDGLRVPIKGVKRVKAVIDFEAQKPNAEAAKLARELEKLEMNKYGSAVDMNPNETMRSLQRLHEICKKSPALYKKYLSPFLPLIVKSYGITQYTGNWRIAEEALEYMKSYIQILEKKVLPSLLSKSANLKNIRSGV